MTTRKKNIPYEERTGNESIVYFTRDISPAGIMKAYEKVNANICGKVAIKLHTGEKGGPNFTPASWVKEVMEGEETLKNATIVETNTFYKGDRYTTEEHLDTLRTRGWFKSALKYALAIEADSKEEINILTKFTGNVETVLKVYTPESLRKIIKVIAVTASKVKSTNTMFAPKSNEGVVDSNKLAIEAVKESLEDLDSDDVVW